MNPLEIKPGVFWVGAVDWGIRDFHGYVTPRGTTYNNYLIKDKDLTLVDTVKHEFRHEMIENVRGVADPARVVNVVINHIEPDHVSSIDSVMELCPGATIYISEKGLKGLERNYDVSRWRFKVVRTGDTLVTGDKTLTFIETPMLHWPDSMMTYVAQDRLLISQDAFGQHIASANRFDDQFVACASVSELDDAVIDYYANILMPFGPLIKKKIEELRKMGLEIDMIAPDHGVIWRKDVSRILQMYMDMASGKAERSVAIVYDTMWKSTELMTIPIARGIMDEGLGVKVVKLRATPMSVAIKEFWKSRGTLVGSPTLNNIVYPSVAEYLTHLRGLRPKARVVGGFGSFGWGGGAVKEMYSEFERMGLECFGPGVEIRYRPSDEDKDRCYEFGRGFARKVKEYDESL